MKYKVRVIAPTLQMLSVIDEAGKIQFVWTAFLAQDSPHTLASLKEGDFIEILEDNETPVIHAAKIKVVGKETQLDLFDTEGAPSCQS